MKNMSLIRMADVCGGVYYGEESKKNIEVSSITTDSRKAEEGCLFIAIKGERVDGHSFIPAVFEKGALCVLSEQKLENPQEPYILVESSLTAIKKLARYYRKQLDIKVVGITGSVGKTSTKEMIASVLGEKYKVLKTLENFNNELGLPLTIFRLREDDEIAVLEMGISDFGEMHRLSEIACPDVCVITNIGQCHLEYLHDRDGILRAKSEIFDFIAENGTIVLNGDDDKLSGLTQVKGIVPHFFGIETKRELYADELENLGLKGIRCRIHAKDESFQVDIPIPGYHMVQNALAATAVGLSLGLTLKEIHDGIEKLEAISGRFHLIETDRYTIIDDCYNANPVSMKASLTALQDGLFRKVAILGDMGELGADEEELHREVGKYAADLNIDLFLCVGTLCRNIAEGIWEKNPDKKVQKFDTVGELLQALPQILKEKDTIHVKASHFMKFDQIVSELKK